MWETLISIFNLIGETVGYEFYGGGVGVGVGVGVVEGGLKVKEIFPIIITGS